MLNFRETIDRYQRLYWLETILLEDFDIDRFLTRIKSVQALIDRGATEGERSAANHAMDRLLAHAEEAMKDISPDVRRRIQTRIAAIRGSGQPEPRHQERETRAPRFRPGSWVYGLGHVGKVSAVTPNGLGGYIVHVAWTDGDAERGEIAEHFLRPATQDEIDAALARSRRAAYARTGKGQWEILLIAHFRRLPTSDKIYGVAQRGNEYITFWGKFGAKVSVKRYGRYNDALDVYHSKIDKGYRAVKTRNDPVPPSYRYLEEMLTGIAG